MFYVFFKKGGFKFKNCQNKLNFLNIMQKKEKLIKILFKKIILLKREQSGLGKMSGPQCFEELYFQTLDRVAETGDDHQRRVLAEFLAIAIRTSEGDTLVAFYIVLLTLWRSLSTSDSPQSRELLSSLNLGSFYRERLADFTRLRQNCTADEHEQSFWLFIAAAAVRCRH